MYDAILSLWVLPSLICLLVYLQFRHLKKETLKQFIDFNNHKSAIMLVIFWPAFIFSIVLTMILLPVLYIAEKFDLNLNFLINEIKIGK